MIGAVARITEIRARFESTPLGSLPLGGPRRPTASESPSTVTSAAASSVARTAAATSFGSVLSRLAETSVDDSTANGFETLSPSTPFSELFRAAGAAHGISPRLLAAVATIESGFDTKAVSKAGAQGLMQFMPSTAAGMGVDPWDPASAIDGAARLLVGHRQRFGSIASALAAYNEGGGTVARYGGKVPPQTQNYVDKVLSVYRGGSS